MYQKFVKLNPIICLRAMLGLDTMHDKLINNLNIID